MHVFSSQKTCIVLQFGKVVLNNRLFLNKLKLKKQGLEKVSFYVVFRIRQMINVPININILTKEPLCCRDAGICSMWDCLAVTLLRWGIKEIHGYNVGCLLWQ